MADISTSVRVAKAANIHQVPWDARTYDIVPVRDGVSSVATHNIIPLAAGDAFLGGYGIVLTSFTSSGSATVQFKIGSDALTEVIPVASLAAGDVIKLETGQSSGAAQTQDDLTDSSGGTANTTIADVLSSLTDYTPHASGATAVTSNAATDLDTTASALETLRDEVNTMLGNINDNFADIAAQLAKIKTDVASIIPSYSMASYAVSADTIDMTVGTAALTAGKILLVCNVMDVGFFS